jgi:hypothetical protein
LAETLDVVFIAGWSYSGSTLLANVLGELDGFLSVGELRYVWRHGLVEGQRCGCGSTFSDCPFWSVVARDHLVRLPARRLAWLEERILRTRAFRELVLARQGRGRLAPLLDEYARALEVLYRGIARVSGCRVIVDSTKAPPYGYVLEGVRGIRLTVVHVVRDPRGTAFSYRRREGGMGVVRSMALWDAWHGLSELLWRDSQRHLRLRYEDFVGDPASAVAAISSLVGGGGVPTALGEGRVALRPNHNVSGNRNRFRSGVVELKVDDEWRLLLRRRELALATALSWPLRVRYGYRRMPRPDEPA